MVNLPCCQAGAGVVVNLQCVGYRCENVVSAGCGVESRARWAVCCVHLSDVSTGFPGACTQSMQGIVWKLWVGEDAVPLGSL